MMPRFAFLLFAIVALFTVGAGAAPAKKNDARPLPVATFDSVPYGLHLRQVMDVWLPEKCDSPSPAIVFIHGGGFTNGDRKDSRLADRIPKCHANGVALIAVEYRFLKDAKDVKPPVKACLDDVLAALRFIRTKAKEWNIDASKIGLTGSSAGGCASLFASLTEDNIFGIKAVYVQYPQTSLDPKEMREWIPNSKYGAKLFGYSDFQTWLDNRDQVLPWIEKFSAAALLRRCTPSKAPVFFYSGPKAPPPGQLAKDPTHSGTFNDKFREIAENKGVSYKSGNHDSLIKALIK
jgi:acetyl esterase/lipase